MSLWAVVPAAGVGKRVGADRPQQYLSLANRKTIVETTLAKLSQINNLVGIVVAVGPEDGYWQDQDLPKNVPVVRVDGGKERADSVLNALNWLAEHQSASWALVHDVARPCVRLADIEHLISRCQAQNQGGLLAIPATDTLKKTTDAQTSMATVDRSQIWQAQTPQLFPFSRLRQNLQQALNEQRQITDEASAMEMFAEYPLLIEGHSDNIKVTRPEDLALASFYLKENQ